jgi:EmrB/QacA subfamily drug resistance transporter
MSRARDVTGSPPPAGSAPDALTHAQILVVLSGLMLGLFLASLDQTVVATALPTIVGELGGIERLSWVVTAYLLAATASSPLYGKISDLYGRKQVFQFSIVVFMTGSLLAGVAQDMTQLIACRALQGLGAGGLIVMALTIIGDVVSPRQRGKYQGYMGAVFAVSSIAGPLLGGLFVDHLSWRWIFFVNLPIGALALAVTTAVLDLPRSSGGTRRIDYAGGALLVAAVSAMLLVTVWGGTEHEWGSPTIIALSAVSVILAGSFVLWERRAPEPILPLRLFRNRVYSLSNAIGFIVGLSMLGGIVFLPLFLQVVTGASATASGMLILPLMSGVIGASIGAGRLITRTGRYKIYPVAGSALTVAGLLALSRMEADVSRLQSSLSMLVFGIGLGLILPVLVLAVQNSVDRSDLGTATSSGAFFRSLGGAFGTAIFGAIMAARLGHWLPRLLPDGNAMEPGAVLGSPEFIRGLAPEVQGAVVEAFTRSISGVFLWAVPIAALAFVLVLFLPELPLRDSTEEHLSPRVV